MQKKRCPTCKKQKDLSEFHKSNTRTDGLAWQCRSCAAIKSSNYRKKHHEKLDIYNLQWRERNPEKYKQYALTSHRRKKFGIEPKQYDEMNAEQNGVCLICGLPETVKRNGNTRTLCVDHSHETDEIRGLLCSKCNLVLGLINDSTSILSKMILYLEKKRKEIYDRQCVSFLKLGAKSFWYV